MDAIPAFVPEEQRIKYSAMTGQSLYYLSDADLAHKVLAVVEEEGAERASYALFMPLHRAHASSRTTWLSQLGRVPAPEILTFPSPSRYFAGRDASLFWLSIRFR